MSAADFLASIGAKFATPEEHAAAVKAVGEIMRSEVLTPEIADTMVGSVISWRFILVANHYDEKVALLDQVLSAFAEHGNRRARAFLDKLKENADAR